MNGDKDLPSGGISFSFRPENVNYHMVFHFRTTNTSASWVKYIRRRIKTVEPVKSELEIRGRFWLTYATGQNFIEFHSLREAYTKPTINYNPNHTIQQQHTTVQHIHTVVRRSSTTMYDTGGTRLCDHGGTGLDSTYQKSYGTGRALPPEVSHGTGNTSKTVSRDGTYYKSQRAGKSRPVEISRKGHTLYRMK